MSSISFGADNSRDRLNGIISEYNEFLEDDLNTTKANSLCTNLWHLTDWIWKEYTFRNRIFNNIGDFRNSLYIHCEYLKIMHDITNSHKHFSLDRPKANIRESREHIGPFDPTLDSTFDTSQLEIELEDGTVLYAKEVIKNVLDFWENYFNSKLT